MIMAGYEYRGEKPFGHVYFTGIVRDKIGRKMSKQLGNSPDPLDLIAQFGADGMRVAMLLSSSAGNDVMFDEALCEPPGNRMVPSSARQDAASGRIGLRLLSYLGSLHESV